MSGKKKRRVNKRYRSVEMEKRVIQRSGRPRSEAQPKIEAEV